MSDPLLNHSLGQYQILNEIGRGGMAVVYKAWQPNLKRYVAVKVLPPHFAQDAEFVRRFKEEAWNSANLNHSNIVHIYDTDIQGGYQYIVMELLEGETLQSLISSNGILPLPRAANILAQIASALDYAHSRGIVHRDVKPANIIISPEDRATLTDFGIAKALEGTRIASSSHLIGTPSYMAPEQIQNQGITAQCDIYSLGIVAYEMLTGRVPFDGNTAAILHAHVYQPPPPLQSPNRQIPHHAEQAVLRALAKSPQERYLSANAFADAIRKTPIQDEYHPTRKPIVIIAAIALVALCVLGSVLYSVMSVPAPTPAPIAAPPTRVAVSASVPPPTTQIPTNIIATPSRLVSKSAAEINLQSSDLGSQFQLAKEDRSGSDGSFRKEANSRIFVSNNTPSVGDAGIAVSWILILQDTIPTNTNTSDTLNAIATDFETGFRASLRNEQTLSTGAVSPVSIGNSGIIKPISVTESQRPTLQGYLIFFAKQNVLVLVAILTSPPIQPDVATTVARMIELRIQ